MSQDSALLPRRGYLGFGVVATAATGPGVRERWLVSEVDPGSPAAMSDLAPGDEVFALDGVEVQSLADLRLRAAARRPGQEAQLLVLRGDTELHLTLKCREMPLESLSVGHVELGEVRWTSAYGDIPLRALWTVPERAPWAAVWLLPSATWLSQENPLSTWDPTYHLVNELTAAGVVTLRVDRSGLGDSAGPPCSELDFDAEMGMWRAARAYYLAHSRVASLPRFVYGRSLGGMLAPLLAVHFPFAGVAVWGTSSQPWHEASVISHGQQLRLQGIVGEDFRTQLRAMEHMSQLVVLEGKTPEEARAFAPELADAVREEFQAGKAHGRVVSFFQQLQRAEVRRAWQSLEAPVLAMHGEYDLLTSAVELADIAELVASRGTFVELGGIDHFLHERASLHDAVQAPWGGAYSPRVTAALLEFFRQAALTGR